MLTRLSSITVDKWIKQHFIICFIFYLNVLELYETKRLINSFMEQETKKTRAFSAVVIFFVSWEYSDLSPDNCTKGFFFIAPKENV